jgi:hypothetical protein
MTERMKMMKQTAGHFIFICIMVTFSLNIKFRLIIGKRNRPKMRFGMQENEV